MKEISRVLVVALATILFAGFAGAATIGFECPPFPVTFDDGVGADSVTCAAPVGVPVGSTLNSVTVSFLADYQFGLPGLNVVDVTFTPSTAGMPGGSSWTLPTTTLQVTGGGSSSAPLPSASAILGAAGVAFAFANGFDVAVSSAVNTGAVATSSGAVSVVYDFTAPPGEIPEPATFAMLGGGLLALGIFARRRRA